MKSFSRFSIKKNFLESSFFKVIGIIRKNKLAYAYTIGLDFIFLALLFFIGKYTGSLIPKDPQQLMALFETRAAFIIFAFAYPIAYYLLIILIYSFVKLAILNLIKSLYIQHKFSLDSFGRFYLLNVLIFLASAIAGLVLVSLLALMLTQNSLKYSIIILSIPFFFFIYSMLNISSTLFIKSRIKGIAKKSLGIALGRIKEYGMFIIWDAILILAYLVIYNSIHFIFRAFVFSNNEILSAYGGIYLKIFNIISIAIFYIIISFNRIYFYERIGKNVL